MALLQSCVLVICLAICVLAQQEAIVETSPKPIDQQALDAISVWDYKNEQTKDGYRYSYQTSDNSNRQQEGKVLYPGTDKEELVVTGTYTYRHGNYETVVEYTADKNGYKATVYVRWAPIYFIPPKLLGSLAG